MTTLAPRIIPITPAPDPALSEDGVRSLFTRSGLRCTRQRMAIYEALAATRTHPTAEELFAQVHGDCEGLSLATVYNTLEALCDAGLCRKIPTTNGSARFDAVLAPHSHVVIAQTGEIRDVPAELGTELLSHLPQYVMKEIERTMGVEIDRISLQLVARPSERSQTLEASRQRERRGI